MNPERLETLKKLQELIKMRNDFFSPLEDQLGLKKISEYLPRTQPVDVDLSSEISLEIDNEINRVLVLLHNMKNMKKK